MKKLSLISLLLALVLLLAACIPQSLPLPTEVPTETPIDPPTEPPTEPEHSDCYIPGIPQEGIITFFNEVTLDVEIPNAPGDPAYTQVRKWINPIRYVIVGDATEEDYTLVREFMQQLSEIPGMPEISEAPEDWANFTIHFADLSEFLAASPGLGEETNGYTTVWWYDDTLDIHTADVYIRTDLDQEYRNRVILHELYQSFGTLQDTTRMDSIIYNDYLEADGLSDLDWLIITLLYHQDILCGMDAAECEEIIRQLYY